MTQLRVRRGQTCVNQGVAGRKLQRFFPGLNRRAVMAGVVERVSESFVKLEVVRRELQRQPVFILCPIQHAHLAISRGAGHVRRAALPEQLLRLFRFLQGLARAVHLEIRKGQAEMSNAVVWADLERRLEIPNGAHRVLHVIARVSAVDQGFHHARISFQRAREIIDGLLQQLVLTMDVAGQQREVRFLGQHRLIPADQSQHFVITAQVVEIVGEIDGSVAVVRHFLDRLLAQPRRLRVLAFQKQVAFVFAHDARIILEVAGGAGHPSVDGRVGAAGDDLRVARRQSVCLFVVGLRLIEHPGAGVEVTECHVRNVVVGIDRRHAREIQLCA